MSEYVPPASDGWTKHTPYHWQQRIQGKLLDYWPSKNKFMYDGKVTVGDVYAFIASLQPATTCVCCGVSSTHTEVKVNSEGKALCFDCALMQD